MSNTATVVCGRIATLLRAVAAALVGIERRDPWQFPG
jgi:hypothetical protein